jgi:hypothetical protein
MLRNEIKMKEKLINILIKMGNVKSQQGVNYLKSKTMKELLSLLENSLYSTGVIK